MPESIMQGIKQSSEVNLSHVTIEGESYYKISNHDDMDPFLMSIVSDSNHWMFISSNGGLTAGRKDSENALFPYYTDDKLTELYDTTGSKSIFSIISNGVTKVWEPFSNRNSDAYSCTRNLYKNFYGNKVIFEEINHDLQISFSYQWSSSNKYGFVRKSTLKNYANNPVIIKLLDGIQNIQPFGVTSNLQAIRSNLIDAYKKSELEVDSGLGIYALSAIIVDRAEPSEALKANIVWSKGLQDTTYLLSSTQLEDFRRGEDLSQEVDIKAKKGAYFISKEIELDGNGENSWMIIANVNQTATSIAKITKEIKTSKTLLEDLQEDIELGSQRLRNLVSASDGIQLTADKKRDARHYSNTLFNIMRGGIFDDNYQIEKWDFSNYISQANKKSFAKNTELLIKLPEKFSLQDLRKFILEIDDQDFVRLAKEYMPLKFSRRHGDPSRPWNKFSINTRNEKDGSKILDYEGNWRDIFQNWEALAHAYPEFIDSMILKFLNASTFDGYNPYRVTKGGFDWEAIEEHDPWSYIGYWGDHQIIYLLKFLEFAQGHYPGSLKTLFDKDVFVYANVPYKIKSYNQTLKTPKDTIVFDYDLDNQINDKRIELGSDGALLSSQIDEVYRVNFIEKILATVLAKLSNFIPEGGIWLNTQRPEWNDANNALVGNGVSMVTLCYLRRFLNFFQDLLKNHSDSNVKISKELIEFFSGINRTLKQNQDALNSELSDKTRKTILDGLGQAGSDYRDQIYSNSFSGKKDVLVLSELKEFITCSLTYIDHSIRANKRNDNMYHAYNLMTVEDGGGISISYLDEMLEGQVAALSSGYLSAANSLELLDALKSSKLFRADQYSYLLYPNKELPRFMNKNVVPKDRVESSALFNRLLQDGERSLIEKDVDGNYHFNGDFNNAQSVQDALKTIPEKYQDLVKKDSSLVLQIFEEVFNHKAFTGRSGTFFGYEGLGSIYWHMVSKLLLAVEEVCVQAIEENQKDEVVGRLLEHYYEINEGIGLHKSPKLYGAFSIDPYSHTPSGKGAQQPGMTGQVKEDILSRIGELGVSVKEGQVHFDPCLLRADEFVKEAGQFEYIDVNQNRCNHSFNDNSLAFTYCQVPVIYKIDETNKIELVFEDGSSIIINSLVLTAEVSEKLFKRTGEIECVRVFIKNSHLK